MPKFNIGDVVTLRTHPFCVETNNVIISGEYQMIPPLMVVIESINHSTSTSEKEMFDKFKCLWFSTKENQFKENYFCESDLKLINYEKDSEMSSIKTGDLVTLLTSSIELGKKRSFLNTETNNTGTKSTSSVTGLLTFISPVMTAIEVSTFNPERDKKTSPEIKTLKSYPEKIVKCKWFDSVAEKFSECWIAESALSVLPEVPRELVALIEKTISVNACLKLETTIIRPNQISNRSGYYYLNHFDHILQQNRTIKFSDIEDPVLLTNPFKRFAPIFKKRNSKGKKLLKLITTVEDLIKKVLESKRKSYIVIKYQDQFNNITTRTISKYEFMIGDNITDLTGPKIKYVRAYCHLRQSERNFRLDSILEASELDISF